MRSEKPSWPRILRRHCTEGLDGWTFTKKAMIAARGRERQKRTRNAQCYNFTSQKCNRNGNATLSLSLSLSMSMCQCCLSHRWLALGWGTGPGLIAHGTQRNFEEIASLLVTFVYICYMLHSWMSCQTCHLLDLGHYPWTAQIISWCWLPRRLPPFLRLQVLVACGWLVEGTQDCKRLNLRGA